MSHESESPSGEKRGIVEAISMDVPGTTRDGSPHLVERKTSVESSNLTGVRANQQRIEQTSPGDPGSGVSACLWLVDGRVVPGPAGEQSTVTIRARDSNGNVGIVAVNTKSDRIPTIQVQRTPSEKP